MALLGLCWPGWLVAAEPTAQRVEVHLSRGSDSSWTLEQDSKSRQIVAHLADGAEVALEIDYDGPADDQHLVGITPILSGRRLEGAFWGSMAPLIYPQLDPEEHQIERLTIETEGDTLRVRFEGGTYRILDPEGPDEPLFMEALVHQRNDRLEVLLYGLYYLLPSRARTRLEISTAGGASTRRVEPGDDGETTLVHDGSSILSEVKDEASRHLEYFDRVIRVDIDDSRFGRMELETYAERLQIQVNRPPGVIMELFELDFDHTFKDRGQRRVMSRLSIELP